MNSEIEAAWVTLLRRVALRSGPYKQYNGSTFKEIADLIEEQL